MVLRVKVIAEKPDNPNSIPGTHMMEKTKSCKLSSDVSVCM